MTDFILGVFEITIGMSLFIALLLIGLKLFGGKFTAKCRYIIWALVMLRLAIPFSFGLLPTLIEIPIDTELVETDILSPEPSENTDPITPTQPADPGEVLVNPNVPGTTVFPTVPGTQNADTVINPDQTQTLPGDQAETVIPSEPIVETPDEQPMSLHRVLDIAGIVYLTGAAVFLVWSLVSYFIYTRKILRSAKAANERTQQIFSTICKKYGMKKQPTLLVASGIHSPAAFGIFRRKIVLPDIAFSENGLVGTLAHEVTHCKRGDLYMKLVELIACSLNWFNPLVHISAFKCEMEMELSCDEKVLSGSSDAARAAYGEVMLDIIRRCRRNRGALTTHFNPKKSAVTARFKNILYGSGKRRGRILIGVCLVLCILAGTFVACQIGDDLPEDHWYAEGYYLKCDNGSDVIVMDADGANPASPCEMTAADEAVSFEGLTDGDRIKVEISMIMTTYPGQTDVYSIEKLSDGERDDIDPAVMESLRELGWIDDTSNQKELPKYLEIPVITLTQIETLPYSEETAVFTASPVGGNPTIFFFDDSRTFYFRKYLSTNMDAEFFTGTLTLPDGFTDAKLLHVTRGAGSGEIFVSIEAIYDGKKEYLTYGFFGTEAPSGVYVLDDVQVQRLMEAMEQIITTQITEYKFNIPLEDRLDYIVPASIYGEIHPYVIPDRYAPYIQTNEYSPDGVGYVTFGVANDMKPSNVFSRCYTYRITQKGGYIVSVEEVETITKETVLQNGTPYSGNSAGRFTGVAYDRTRTATVSGNEISVGSYQSHTDAGGTYVGTYTYDAKTGDFFAELAFQYHDNGNFITNDPETISGKLYEYGGFVHFVCTSSNISTVNVNDTLPMTFFPVASNEEYQMTKYTETLTGDNGKTYQISFDLPAEWTYGSGGIFEDANGNKRIGNRVIAVDISKEDFVSSLEEMAERYHVDLDSPIKGTSDSGIAYMGYCFEGEREIPGDITGRYLYRFTYSDSISMHMDVWKRNAYDDDSFYEQFVLPIIQSVTIGETGGQTDQILNTEELSTYSLIPSGTAGCIVSLTLPSTWKWDGSHFNEANVRIGVYSDQKRVSLYGALPTLQEFEATLRESTSRVYQMDSPITGKTDTGYSFTGYYGDEEMPKGEMSRRYLFYITADQGVYTLEIWQRLDFDGANFLAETVLPIVQSFAIQQTLPHQAILEDRSALYDTLSKKEMLLSDWLKNNEYAVSQYTVIDLDHDADLETVLWLTRGSDAYAGFLILHSNAGKTNAHLLYYRQFADLKEDGTFSFSSGVSNHGFGEIRFTGEACSISRIAYCESEDNTTVFYYSERDSRSLTKAEYESWERAQSNKSDPVWYAWNANEEHSAQPIDFSSIGGDWYHSFNYEGWYAFYGLNFRSQTAEMQFDHGLYESEYAHRYSGTYTVDPATQEITAVLHDGRYIHNDPDITIKFTIKVQTEQNNQTLILHILACDVPRYQHLVGQSLAFTREFGYAELEYQTAQNYYQMWYDKELTVDTLLDKSAVKRDIAKKIMEATGIKLLVPGYTWEYAAAEDRFPLRFFVPDGTGKKMIETNIIRYKDEQDGMEKYAVEVNPTVIPIIDSVTIGETVEETITDIADWDKLPWSESWERWGSKPAPNAYNFIYNLVSGESEIPEYNGLGITEYSISVVEDEGSGIGTTLSFTFKVAGLSLPSTLIPAIYTWTLYDGMGLFVYQEDMPTNQEEYTAYENRMRGLHRFEGNSAVEAVDTYLSWMPYIYEVSPYGEWDPENYHLPYNYICAHYGKNLEISFSELQKLMTEKFGIEVERPEKSGVLSRCKYDKERDTVHYADTRSHTAVHRFLDVREEDGITYVSVMLFADKHYIIPSHTIQYKIGEGDVFLGCEIIREGNYEPRELS